MEPSSADLLDRYRAGDEGAATEIFRRYLDRLTLLVRSRLSSRLAARTDPEDIVQSAYRSFFLGAERGRFSLKRSGDLWRVLVSITLHKLYRGVKRHTAQARSVDVERDTAATLDLNQIAASSQPTPDQAVALADLVETVMSRLDDFGRRVLEMRLQGEQITEIAADTGRSERSVRRSLSRIRAELARRLGANVDA